MPSLCVVRTDRTPGGVIQSARTRVEYLTESRDMNDWLTKHRTKLWNAGAIAFVRPITMEIRPEGREVLSSRNPMPQNMVRF